MSQKSHRLIVIELWLVIANVAISAPAGLLVKPANETETLNAGDGRNQRPKTTPPPAKAIKRATSVSRRVVWRERSWVMVVPSENLFSSLNACTCGLIAISKDWKRQYDGLESVAMRTKALDCRA